MVPRVSDLRGVWFPQPRQIRFPFVLLVKGEPRTPDADKVRDLTGFAIGGIPPFGHDSKLATFMDADLLGYDIVWAAAGTPRAVFPVQPQRLQQAVGAEVIRVA